MAVSKHINTKRLIIFVYYAQAMHLAVFGKPLFYEELQAWDYGPVVPEVYKAL